MSVLRRPRVRVGGMAWGLAALAVAAVASAEGARLAGTLSTKLALVLPFGILVALVAVVGAFARPRVTFAAAFALLGVVRVEPAPTDALFMLLILAGVLGGARLRPRVPVPVAVILAAFVSVTLLSLTSAESLSTGLRFESITIYLAILAVWLTHALQDADLVQLGVKAYIWCAVISSIVAVAALELHFPGGTLVTYANQRAMGLFKDPNVFAPYLIPPMAILLEEIGRPRLLGWSRRRNVVLLLILMGGLVFAYSRAAWVNFAIAAFIILVTYALRHGGMRAFTRMAAVLVGAGLAALLALVVTGQLSLFESRSKLQGYDNTRFANQALAISKSTARVFGHGPGQAPLELVQSSHSVYVETLFESGVIGIALLIALFVATLLCALGMVLRDGDVHGVGSAALLGVWAGHLLNSGVVDTLHWRHAWIVAAMIWLGSCVHMKTATREAPA
ncbi:MAG: O-antigen ligase family protein [Gaiellales bacterium]